MEENIQINISQEKEFEYFTKIIDLGYKVVANPYYEDYISYDPEEHAPLIARLSEDFTREIKGNFLKFRALNQHTLYLNQIKTDLSNLLSDYSYKNAFYEDFNHFRSKILNEINLLEGNNSSKTDPCSPNIKLIDVALKYAIEGKPINESNKDQIAKRYGFNSGHRLYQDYNYYHNQTDRIGDPGTKGKLKKQIERYNRVLDIIDHAYRTKALDELSILSALLSKY